MISKKGIELKTDSILIHVQRNVDTPSVLIKGKDFVPTCCWQKVGQFEYNTINFLLLTLGAHAQQGLLYLSCVYVCVCMYVCVHSYLPHHTLQSHNRDTNGFTVIQQSFYILPIFLKMLHSKLWRNMPTSSSSGILELFPQEIRFYASVKPIATSSLLRQWACGRQRAICWHRLVKRHRYTDRGVFRGGRGGIRPPLSYSRPPLNFQIFKNYNVFMMYNSLFTII